jgi:DNA invertase Pin-like site-specific DNA recombinase
MYLEECWHPNLGKTRTLCWSEPRESKAGVDEFKRDAIRILDGATPIGRPPGKRKFHSQEEFIPRYREAYLKAEKLGGATPKLVAAEMKISRSTFFRRLNEFHLEFPPDLT